MLTKTYLPSSLCDINDGSDSSDSSDKKDSGDSSDSSGSSGTSDSCDSSDQKTFFFLPKNFFFLITKKLKQIQL